MEHSLLHYVNYRNSKKQNTGYFTSDINLYKTLKLSSHKQQTKLGIAFYLLTTFKRKKILKIVEKNQNIKF